MKEKKLKILMISRLDVWSLGEKKGNQSMYNTLMGYARRGHEVHLITFGGGGLLSSKDKTAKEIHPNVHIYRFTDFDVKYHRIVKKIPILRCLKTGYFVNQLSWLSVIIASFIIGYQIIKRTKINILYGYEAAGVPAAFILGRIFHIPNISRFQGCIFYDENLKNPVVWLKYPLHIMAYKIPADLVIMTNDGTKGDEVLSRLKTPMKQMRFWRNGIKSMFIPGFDSGKFKQTLGISPYSKIILSVSRLHDWKRVDRIISAMPSIVAKQRDVLLLIVGDGIERNNLEALSRELMVDQYIRFIGAISHDEIPAFMNAADIFVSLYDKSNVGNPLFEAMTCGRCIVTLNNGTTGELIKNNDIGVLLNLDELNRLPDIIISLLKDEEKRKRLGLRAKEYADTHFWTWEERMAQEVGLVQKIAYPC